jgi:flagellar hook assembly protein FlgD
LVANALIKITDVSGNLVNNVEANGGTAEWNGKNIYGERVSTGVYLLYISDENGENTKVMKLLFIH